MARLIDAIETRRMELIDRRKLVSDFWKGVEDCAILSYDDTEELMENAPTVDAVEVVRCRDCKRCFKHTTKRNRQKMWICMRNEVDVCVRPDDFCSYGERKDNV